MRKHLKIFSVNLKVLLIKDIEKRFFHSFLFLLRCVSLSLILELFDVFFYLLSTRASWPHNKSLGESAPAEKWDIKSRVRSNLLIPPDVGIDPTQDFLPGFFATVVVLVSLSPRVSYKWSRDLRGRYHGIRDSDQQCGRLVPRGTPVLRPHDRSRGKMAAVIWLRQSADPLLPKLLCPLGH